MHTILKKHKKNTTKYHKPIWHINSHIRHSFKVEQPMICQQSILIYSSAGSKSVLILLRKKAANLPSDITSFLFRVECCNLKRSVRMKTLIPEA